MLVLRIRVIASIIVQFEGRAARKQFNIGQSWSILFFQTRFPTTTCELADVWDEQEAQRKADSLANIRHSALLVLTVNDNKMTLDQIRF